MEQPLTADEEPQAGEKSPEQPSRAEARRREEFQRLCASGYTVCCG